LARRRNGRKELVGFTDGALESAQDWRDLLLDLKRRGIDVPPRLAIADGALGFWKAAGEVWPKTREQRSWVHKTATACGAGCPTVPFPIRCFTISPGDSPLSCRHRPPSTKRRWLSFSRDPCPKKVNHPFAGLAIAPAAQTERDCCTHKTAKSYVPSHRRESGRAGKIFGWDVTASLPVPQPYRTGSPPLPHSFGTGATQEEKQEGRQMRMICDLPLPDAASQHITGYHQCCR
jgi:hypothetical protein